MSRSERGKFADVLRRPSRSARAPLTVDPQAVVTRLWAAEGDPVPEQVRRLVNFIEEAEHAVGSNVDEARVTLGLIGTLAGRYVLKAANDATDSDGAAARSIMIAVRTGIATATAEGNADGFGLVVPPRDAFGGEDDGGTGDDGA